MGKCFDQSKPIFACADFSFEQRREALACDAGFCNEILKTFEGAVMVVDQLAHTQRQARERCFMSAQNQMIFARIVRQAFAGLHPVTHRISFGFGRIDANV